MSGEYDCSCTPERTLETASRIKGSKVTIMKDLGHFPMCENPALFETYLMPVLLEIANHAA
jgi:pimeloyl-ACP methyl ester carboxylesterase